MLTDELKQSIQQAYSSLLESKGLTARYGQRLMIAEVARTLASDQDDTQESSVCVVEAGTGTGKTIAYAVSAIPIAQALEKTLVNASYSDAQIKTLRNGVVKQASEGRFRHFTSAEQAFLAVETLNIALAENSRLEGRMDDWFATVEDENDFVPLQFSVRAKKLMGEL